MTKSKFGTVFLLWGAGLGAAAQYAKVSIVFDQLPNLYPDAGNALGFAVSLVGFLGILFGVVAGVLVARIRYRRALLWALWLGAAVSSLQALVPPFEYFLLLRCIEGISHLGLVVAAPTLIGQLSAAKDRGFTLTLWGTFFGVAFAVLAWAGLPLVASFGISALFAAHAAYMALFALILTFALNPLDGQTTAAVLSFADVLRRHLTIYKSARISAPGLGWLFYTFSFVSLLTVLPPYLPEASRAFVMETMPLASIASSMTLGVFLLRRHSAIWVIMLGFLLSFGCMVWLWIMPGLPLACILLACAMGLIQGASFASVPQLNETAESQAQANGALAQMGNLGNTIGTPVIVAGLAMLGYGALPLFVGAAFVMGFLVHWALRIARNAA